MAKKSGLGKGLAALIPDVEINGNGIIELGINEIEPNAEQPRKLFDQEKIKNLAESIAKHGVIQPLIVTNAGDNYKIIAGERRWRAARLAGLKTVPVIIKDVSGRDILEMALIENLQREDLNPIEEAEAYERLLNEFKMTQEELSRSVGKSRSVIANSVRLLTLCNYVKEKLINSEISSGHARALVALESEELQKRAVDEIINKNLNVRQTEEYIKKLKSSQEAKKTEKIKQADKSEDIDLLEERLRGIFGTKVRLIEKNNKGKIEIEYFSAEDRERIIDMLNELAKK